MNRRRPFHRARHRIIAVFTTAVALAVASGTATTQADPGATDALRPTVLAEIPHEPTYVEGFQIDGQALYEGTGRAGESQLRELDPTTGAVRRAVAVPGGYFGEGITVVGDRIWQLTYQDGVAVEWDKASLTPLREVPIAGEGWGLCRDGGRLVRSDGTDRLRFHDTASFAEIGSVTVTLDGQPARGLNELECVDGQVWANVWPTDVIVRIDPASGAVNAVVNAAALRDAGRGRTDVLNGIAHLAGDEFLLTGKNWPTMFRVRLCCTA